MEEYLKSLFKAFESYSRAIIHSVQWWWLVPLTLGGIWLLVFAVTKLLKQDTCVSREYKILSITIKTSIFVELLLIAWFSYNWAKTDLYSLDNEKLIHLICIVISIIIQIIGFVTLSKCFSREKRLRILNCPITRKDEEVKDKMAKEQFRKMKLWVLIPSLGFLLLLLPSNEKNIVSFLLDNSSSMDTHLSNGKEILSNTFQNMDNNTDVILSWFSESDPRRDLSSIIDKQNYAELEGIHTFFTNKESALASLSDIEITEGTPLVETIWSNYLFTKEQTENKEYTRKIFVMVTDGGDIYIDDEMSDFLCGIPDFSDFYQDNISIINLTDENNIFFEKATECNYSIYEGMDIDSYSSSVNHILGGVSKDRYFPVWLFIFSMLGIFITVFINPKKR